MASWGIILFTLGSIANLLAAVKQFEIFAGASIIVGFLGTLLIARHAIANDLREWTRPRHIIVATLHFLLITLASTISAIGANNGIRLAGFGLYVVLWLAFVVIEQAAVRGKIYIKTNK